MPGFLYYQILFISTKDIINHFPSIANKYGCVRLSFMVKPGAGKKNIFRKLEQIQLAYIHHQSHGYFGLAGIGIFGNALPKTLIVSDVLNLATSTQQVQNFHEKVRSDMIAKSIECSIKKTYLKKLSIHRG